MKIGDKVRFLSEVGGGIVKGFQGKDIVLVEDEDGFDIPMNKREVVVIDTDDYNLERTQKTDDKTTVATEKKEKAIKEDEIETPVVELKGGDVLNVYLAYVPEDIKMINSTSFDAYIVNDSNYFLYYTYLSGENNAWTVRSQGEIAPNMKVWMENFMQSDLNEMERVCIQMIAFKKNKPFELHSSIDVCLHIDTVKFYKFHCFKESDFFESPSMLYTVVKDNLPLKQTDHASVDELQKEMMKKKSIDEQKSAPARNMIKKDKKDETPIIDLHIEELLDTTSNMGRGEILNYQLNKFREEINKYANKHGQKIIFIHGKGDGILRNAILNELKRKYNNSCSWQDASFQEYGFGATEVKIK